MARARLYAEPDQRAGVRIMRDIPFAICRRTDDGPHAAQSHQRAGPSLCILLSLATRACHPFFHIAGEPTIAPMPGTTLGLINVPGLPLGPKNRAFDTPGVEHPYQLTSFLGFEDVKRVLPSKQLKGRVRACCACVWG